MRRGSWGFVAGVVLIVGGLAGGATSARAQAPGAGGALGGYGGSMTDAGAGMAVSGPAIPYAGAFGGFMPYRMGGGGSLSFQSRGDSAMASNRTSFSLSAMSGGTSAMAGGMAPRPFAPLGFGGAMGLGGGMTGTSGTRGVMGVMPPSIGYPFRQPPSLLSTSSPGMGMSM